MSDTEQVPAGPGPAGTSPTATATAASIERNGINVIAESERKGKPADLFWPWFAANISVLGRRATAPSCSASACRSGRA